MKVVAALALLSGAQALSESASNYLLAERFEAFKTEFGKKYSGEEHHRRFQIFEKTVERVAELNKELAAKGEDQVHGITKFADQTKEEFQAMLGLNIDELPKLEYVKPSKVVNASGSFNWNDQGVLTAVKNQGMCGSCWAFATVETVEAAWVLNGNTLTEFAPQQLVSCDNAGNDQGCNGGMPQYAYEYIESAGGLATEADYPYTSGRAGITGTCQDFTVSGGTVSSYAFGVPQCTSLFSSCDEDSDAVASALQSYGPAAIAVDASEWSSYTGGVMTTSSCSSLSRKMDHAVQLVGYNADASTPYWIVRNSWDTTWGEDGFIYLKMGDNTCGVANYVSQVTGI